MLKARVIVCLTFLDGVLFRTKKFKADYRYTSNWVADTADEIFAISLDASDAAFLGALSSIAERVFTPLAAAGHITSTEDVRAALMAGADKTVINTAAAERPVLITEVAHKFGSQCMVLGIDVGKDGNVWTHHGTTPTALDPVRWASEGVERGAGEVFLQSIERDGSLLGYDTELCSMVAAAVSVPVVVCSGAGAWPHFVAGVNAGATGVATNNIYHFTAQSIAACKAHMHSKGIPVRF